MPILFSSITKPKGYRSNKSWSEIISMIDIREEKDGLLYTTANYSDENPTRRNEFVTSMSGLVIDFDNDSSEKPTTPDDLGFLKDYRYFFHSTHSNFKDKDGRIVPRWRLIIPFKEAVTPELWPDVWYGFYNKMNNDKNIDVSCKALSRAYYAPSSPSSLAHKAFHGENPGAEIDGKLLASWREKNPERIKETFHTDEWDSNDIDDALRYISPDCDYDTWLTIGMALKDELGDLGFSVWDSWSRAGAKYPSQGDIKTITKWKSFTSEGITVASLFKIAIENGWVKSFPQEELKVVIFEGGNLRPVKKNEALPDDLLHAPGLVGEIADWITKTAFRPQPALSLAASIACVGVVMGHRYATETDLRSNILTLGIGPSGCGKDHPRKCVDKLLNAAGLEALVGGNDVTSGSALVNSLQKGGGRRLFQMDEIGRTFGSLTSSKASTFQTEILTNIMQLFSYANGIFKGKEFADKEYQRADIVEPCLCIHGSSVPSRFYAAMSSSEAIDGFLSRWLIFETTTRTPDENYSTGPKSPPQRLVEAIKRINDDKQQGNLAIDKVKVIPCSDQAKQLFREYGKFADEQGDLEYEAGTGFEALWTRAREHAYKLALVTHDDTVGEIRALEANWAQKYVTFAIKKNIAFLKDKLFDNELESESKRVLQIIKAKNDWVGKAEITRKTQWLRGGRRGEILNQLIEADLIQSKKENSTQYFCSL